MRSWARQNKTEYVNCTKKLSDAMADKTGQEEIAALQAKWKVMGEGLQTVMEEVKEDIDAFKKKMAIMAGIAIVFVVVLIAAAAFATGGTALAAMGPVLGAYGSMAVVGLGAVTLIGAATFGVFLMAEPEILQIIEKSKEETVNAINDGLSKIASQAGLVETMLQYIYSDWAEITGAVSPTEAGGNSAFGPNIKALVENLNTTKASIDELVNDIQQTEDVVVEELNTYNEKIFKPLADLYQ
jgi:hypothetical protein